MSRILRLGIGALIFVYGLLIWDSDSRAWALLTLALFVTPLAAQLLRSPMLRAWALWFGILLTAQSLLSPVLRRDYVTLPPNLNSTLDVRTPHKPGMPPGLRHITTDERGFRARPRVDYMHKRGTRIFTIGGSTTVDIVMDDHATWSHLLQEGLKSRGHAVEVINTRVSGLRARNHIATLRVVARLQPDLVIILVGANDWNKHIRDQFEGDRERYWPATLRESTLGKLIARYLLTPLRKRISGVNSADQHLVADHPDVFNADKPRRSLQRPVMHTLLIHDVSAGYRADMVTLSSLCKEIAVRCVFVTQPHAYDQEATPSLRALYWMTPPYAGYTLDLGSMIQIATHYNAFLLDMARRDGHVSCDIAPSIPAREEYFFDDMHFTDAGAQRVAQQLLPCVGALLAQ